MVATHVSVPLAHLRAPLFRRHVRRQPSYREAELRPHSRRAPSEAESKRHHGIPQRSGSACRADVQTDIRQEGDPSAAQRLGGAANP